MKQLLIALIFLSNTVAAQNFDLIFELKQDSTEIKCRLEMKSLEKWVVVNNSERIEFEVQWSADSSFQAELPLFSTYIKGKKSKGVFKGEWVDPSRKGNYSIPFHLIKTQEKETDTQIHVPIELRFKMKFEDDTIPAILLLHYTNAIHAPLYGTVLTETGDYRFLQGEWKQNNVFYLSAFDGTHLFQVEGQLNNKEIINGVFRSGTHYKVGFSAQIDPSYQLHASNTLTWMKNSTETLKLKVRDEKGTEQSFGLKQWKGKITLVQIMGTWCPNCTDESKFVLELYKKYNALGLNVIPVTFERNGYNAESLKRVQSQAKQLGVPYPIYFGLSSEGPQIAAKETFNQLNHMMSFPTLLLVDQNGLVQRIWTGFYGPATGKQYEEHTKELEFWVDYFLKKNK
ncbi:MAG: peroxiredoxin family protein [Bacteroidota bacterium]